MDYEEEGNDVAGSVPVFGAVFMSNIATKKECLRQGVFGLPLAHANFVKHVKAGMILFLFEFEKRQLFGVFRATSDGEVNIMPNAFKSSGKKFPAQVQFTPIWNCSPLSEYEFRDAIRDNYYSAKKFRFGLSEEQVHRLMLLFSSRKLKNFPGSRFTRVHRPIEEERGRFDDARILINDRIGLEPDMLNGLGPALLSEHGRNSLDRFTNLDHEIYSRGDTRENENEIDFDQHKVLRTRDGDSWVKRTSTDSDTKSFVNDVAEKVHYNGHSPRPGSWSEYLKDSLGGRRMVDGPFMAGVLDKDEFPVVSRVHTRNSFSEVGAANKDRYLVNEYNIDNSPGLISTERCNNRETVLADDGNFLIDSFNVKNEGDMDNGCTIFADKKHGEHPSKRSTGCDSYFMNNGYSCCGPVMSTEHIGISLDRGIRVDDGRFSEFANEDRKYNILAEHHPAMARRAIDVGIYPIRERLKHEHNADDNFGLTTSTNYSRYDLVEDRRIGDESRFRKSNGEENGREMGSFCGPVNTSALRLSKQSTSIHTGKPSLQAEFSSLLGRDRNSSAFPCPEDRHVSHISDLTFQDAIATKVVPYDPEAPDIFCGHSSIVVGHGSSPVQDHPFYQGSNRSPCSSLMRESSPYQLELRGSRRYSDGHGYGSTASLSNHHEVTYGTISTSSIDGYSENGEFKTPTKKGSSGLFYSNPSAPFPSKVETAKKDSKGSLSNSFFSSMKCVYHAGSKGKYGYTADEGTTAKELPSSDGRIRLPNGASSSEARPIDHDYEFCRGRENKRVSVFARLTSASEVLMHDPKNDIDTVGDAYDTDASVDKVVAMLHHGPRHEVKKMRKDKVNVKQQDDNRIANFMSTITPTSEQGYEQSKLKVEVDLDQTIEETGGSILEETRHVDFRRRSKAKNNLDRTSKESACKRPAENAETECLVGKTSVENVKVEGSTVSLCKRRKLVRPVFGKKESDEGISCDIIENLKLRSREKFLKVKTRKQQEAIEGSENTNQVALQASCEAEKSSEKCKENAENCQSPSRCPEDEYGNDQLQVKDNPIVISQDPSKNGSKLCGWIEW